MTGPKRFPIVVALDVSEYAEIVLEHAFDQAARHDAADLHFVVVVKPKQELEPAETWLSRLVIDGMGDFRNAHTGDDWHARVHVRAGNTAEEIASLAGEVAARMIVIGRYGTHGRRSVADQVLALAPCPTLVVGLGGLEVDPIPQCPDCVQVRADSDGERWFCAAHSADRVGLSALVPPITSSRGSMF